MGSDGRDLHNGRVDHIQFIIVESFVQFADNALEILFADFARIVVVKELESSSNLLCRISSKDLFCHYCMSVSLGLKGGTCGKNNEKGGLTYFGKIVVFHQAMTGLVVVSE